MPGGCCAPAAASGGVQWPNFVQPPHCEGGFSSTQTMPRKIALPAAVERSSPPRAVYLINAAGGVLPSWRHRPVLQSQVSSAFTPSPQLMDLRHIRLPSMGIYATSAFLQWAERDALSAIHPPPDVVLTPIRTMQRLLPVGPSSPLNQKREGPMQRRRPGMKICRLYDM